MMSPEDGALLSIARLPTDVLVDGIDLDALNQAFEGDTPSLADCRAFLKTSTEHFMTRFDEGADIEDLIFARSWLVDQVLIRCWQAKLSALEGALVAVGGYGRAELLPGSDVDIMVLLAQTEDKKTAEALESFLMMLWDIGLEVGHSVRTLEDCQEQALADITVATNLMEARLMCGNEALFDDMRRLTGPDHVWPDREFFAAKLEEQRVRYEKFDDAVYNLEPNVKEGPGGLRDAQMIGWVFKRHFGTEYLGELVEREDITPGEYETLMQGQRFLWKVRFGLHQITGRREDRLLFDHQRTLAEQFGYTDHEHKLAVEWFMKDYYIAIQALSRLNEMLLQLLQEIILYEDDQSKATTLNRRFQVRKGFLEVTGNGVFKRYPFALLELFLLMQQHDEIRGVRASTIRLVRDSLHLIDDKFREDIRSRSLFMEIFRQPQGLTHELRRMNRYGVLAAYYPAFAHIVGQMQHDLFHAYTVDEHTLFVVRNLRRFSVPEMAHEFPLCSRISGEIPKPELLYLAGFFHDIAKGRGGHHAELGADDAYAFLQQHGLSDYDCKLVSWLVRNHLLMSNVAQRRDITDPDVIHDFATRIGDRTRLNYLYLLTVADIRGTSPSLWNSWKDALFRDLYNATRQALRRGLENPQLRDELIRDIKNKAGNKLSGHNFSAQQIDALWQDFPEDYFLRHSIDELVWHAKVILEAGNMDGVRVDLWPASERGGSALFLYTPMIDRLFNRTTALIDQMGLTITDARIITSKRGYAVNTYLLLNSAAEPVLDAFDGEELVALMEHELLSRDESTATTSRLAPRRIRQFHVNTRVIFHADDSQQRTIVELFTTDYPGLLSRVGQVFYEQDVDLHNAKIATFGSRAEDVFYVTGKDNKPLNETAMQSLHEALIKTLDDTESPPDS
ncbi:[Protein-PII] uridylyltransferase / [Protein-PII]-UMP uridylyl-removing enzyme [hydrothermal vent metagenome]|uniref:[Protein-PII] uridylyltransferase / [Protein-PII]-UMP uridylyl-removing enzyme n=1 Tax=hydrothermal vent metagenome TaxID=652676 RepID=A0A3B0YKL9_9ZZZZ